MGYGLYVCCLLQARFNFQVAYARVRTGSPVFLLIFPLRFFSDVAVKRMKYMSSQWELVQVDWKSNAKLILNLFHSPLCRMQNVQF